MKGFAHDQRFPAEVASLPERHEDIPLSVNLAFAFLQSDKRILLVDLDRQGAAGFYLPREFTL